MNFATDVLPGLIIVIGAPLAIWWYMRRTRGSVAGRLKISEKAAMGKNVFVAVVEVDDKRFLIGAGESGVGLLSELEPLPEVVEEPAEEVADTTNGITEQPRIGLVRRLQLMTVRGPAQTPWRLFGDRSS
ncbi:MAG: flagellar biosynthetic protein FliO [bacterium]|nr:flagellar biosynthetic protein FliO [bacterium]MCP4966779.1 flagellar biosynthetic protein FliO [bacterium]